MSIAMPDTDDLRCLTGANRDLSERQGSRHFDYSRDQKLEDSMKTQLPKLLVASVLACQAPIANAQIVINAFDQGFYDETGFHLAANLNHLTGLGTGPTLEYRGWFAFNLPGGTPQVASASLRVYNPISPPNSGNGYISPDPTETLQLRDVTTPTVQLTAGGTGQTAVFDDLGTGVDFGSRVFSSADNGTYALVPLTSSAVAAINAGIGGQIALGGSLSSISGTAEQVIFGFTHQTAAGFPPQLVLTPVPEPGSLALLATGAFAFRLIHRRGNCRG
jgi:hypothetical protein